MVVGRHSFDDVGVIQEEAVIFAEFDCRKGQTPLVSHVSNVESFLPTAKSEAFLRSLIYLSMVGHTY